MPLTVEASKLTYRIGETEVPTFTATGNTGTVHWTTDHGGLENEQGLITSLTVMPNESWYGSDAVTITARDDLNIVTLKLNVYATFPYQPDWNFEAPVDEDDEISIADDNNEVYRELSGPFGSWGLIFADREFDEYREALKFRVVHRKNRFFYLDDKALEELQLVRFDSQIKRQPAWADGIGYAFTVKAPAWKLPGITDTDSVLFGEGIFGEAIPGEVIPGG